MAATATGETDTIAALTTAVGGPVAVIRISGIQAAAVAARVWRGREPLCELPARQLRLGAVVDDAGDIDHEVLAVFMPGPNSYTGEDVVELHCHGGALGARLVLQRVLQAGARSAEPGEFTKRAFLNGRIDLTQAEAVADLIAAHSEAALHLANRQLQGRLGRTVTTCYNDLTLLLSELEARLDFPEEDLDWIPREQLEGRFDATTRTLSDLLASRREGSILRHGVRLVIAGAPNVGKSSLLNAILGRDRAIVTHLPGTTRDTLEELAHIRGIPVRLVDTAGLRDAEDLIEQSGVERSVASLREAQVVLWVFDVSAGGAGDAWREYAGAVPLILVGNKADLQHERPSPPDGNVPLVTVSAVSGEGLERLYDTIERAVWDVPHEHESEVAVNARHAVLIEAALDSLRDARQRAGLQEWELAATSLNDAIAALGLVTGRTAAPDILDAIFARFCIGK